MPRMYSSLIVCCLLYMSGTSSMAQDWNQRPTTQTWQSLSSQAETLLQANKIDSAIAVGRLALDELRNQPTTADTTVAFLLTRLGGYHFQTGAYAAAESAYARALAIHERQRNPDSAQVASGLANLGFVSIRLGRVAEAESLLLKSLSIRRALFGATSREAGITLGLLGIASFYREHHEESRKRYNEALQILERTGGPDHQDVATVLDNLTVLNYSRLELPDGEENGQRALRIREKTLGANSNEVAETLNKLGLIHTELAQFEKAASEFKRAIQIHEELFGKEYFRLANPYNNLAEVYLRQGIFENTIEPFSRAREIAARRFGTKTGPAVIISSNLAIAYVETKRYAEAEQLLRETIAHGEGELFYAHQTLARLYSAQGKFYEADSLFRHVLPIALRGTPGHENISQTRLLYSQMLHATGDYAGAWKMAREAFLTRSQNFFEDSYALTERERLQFATRTLAAAVEAMSAYSMMQEKPPSVITECAEIILSSKGIVTEAVSSSQPDTSAVTHSLVRAYKAARDGLARAHVLNETLPSNAALRTTTDSLEQTLHELEVTLSKRSYEFSLRRLNARVVPDSLVRLLPHRAALVEYFRVDIVNRPESDSTVRAEKYFAAVLSSERKLEVVDLGRADSIDNLVQKLRAHFGQIESANPSIHPALHVRYKSLAAQLHKMIWRPLRIPEDDNNTIIIAPDGSLNLISFAGLITHDDRYLIERNKIHYVSAGRDLLRIGKAPSQRAEHLIAFGDPDYDAPPETRAASRRIIASVERGNRLRNVRSGCEALGSLKVSRLPATAREVNALSGLRNGADESTEVYTGSVASEENFKLRSSRKRIIHIATHGYYISGDCPAKGSTSFMREHPLLQSGFFLAGANLHGSDIKNNEAEDGIVTALEISAMDLRGTDLVVLSACETGLGKVEQGEGVYGLRRAFQMAGAKTVVSSLWKVPDKETMQFMRTLYSTKAKTYPKLMQQVALKRIREARLRGRPTHPFTWGAFVATGDWRVR